MKEYIEKQALITELASTTPFGYTSSVLGKVTFNVISKMPTADVVEATHGWWIENEDDFWVMCSECGTEFLDDQIGIVDTYKYCPYCGAKMDGERKEQ